MFKKFREWFSQLEFSQKLCISILAFFGFFYLLLVILFLFVSKDLPLVQVIDSTVILPLGEIGFFTGKNASDNIQKIIKAKAEALLKITTDAGCVPVTPIETSTTTTTTTSPV